MPSQKFRLGRASQFAAEPAVVLPRAGGHAASRTENVPDTGSGSYHIPSRGWGQGCNDIIRETAPVAGRGTSPAGTAPTGDQK